MTMMEKLKKYGRSVRWPVPVIQWFSGGEIQGMDGETAHMSAPTVLNLASIVDAFEGIERVWAEHRTWDDASDEMRAGMAAYLRDGILRRAQETGRAVVMLYPPENIADPSMPRMVLVRQYALTVPMLTEWREL